jgi:hypothetical protein
VGLESNGLQGQMRLLYGVSGLQKETEEVSKKLGANETEAVG